MKAFRATENATEAKAQTGGEVKYSVEQTADGKKYVRADRQVIFGNDPDVWSNQVEDYINGKIRKGEDISLIAEDGDVLTITATTAGKLADNHTSRGTTMSDEDFYRKANAAVHIDELAQVSIGDANKTDFDSRHGAFASGGWNYRTAYFEDFDGKYYRLQISAAKNADGTVVYNIGKIEERSLPTINGSSANGGALGGKTSFENSVQQNGQNVNAKFSLSDSDGQNVNAQFLLSDSEGRQLTEAQQVYFKNSKVRDEDGSLLVMYHGTPNGDFTVFRDGTYFTTDKEYADSYRNAGSIKFFWGGQLFIKW